MGFLEQYKVDDKDFPFKDKGGVSYPDAVALVNGVFELGFCGCADPLAVAKFMRDAMNILEYLSNVCFENPVHSDKWNQAFEEWYRQIEAMFHGNRGLEIFVWYWLDEKGFTTHGGAVPGWLEQSGHDLLAALNEAIAYDEAKEQAESEEHG